MQIQGMSSKYKRRNSNKQKKAVAKRKIEIIDLISSSDEEDEKKLETPGFFTPSAKANISSTKQPLKKKMKVDNGNKKLMDQKPVRIFLTSPLLNIYIYVNIGNVLINFSGDISCFIDE